MNFYFRADKGDTDFSTFNREVINKLRELANVFQSKAKESEERGVFVYEVKLNQEDFDQATNKRMAEAILKSKPLFNLYDCDTYGEMIIPTIDASAVSWLLDHLKELAEVDKR